MQHVYGHSGNLGNECADHAAALGSLALFPVATSPLAGFVIILTPLLVVVTVTASVKSAVFLIGFFVTLTHALLHLWFCSQPFSRAVLLFFR